MTGLSMGLLLKVIGYVIYGCLAAMALFGIYCLSYVGRQVKRRRFQKQEEADEFVDEYHRLLQARDFGEIDNLCTTPANWYRAVPLLTQYAVEKRHDRMSRLKAAIGGRFERVVMTPIHNTMAWVQTVIKSAPMLGLLGTVIGMIGAFEKLGQKGVEPTQLATDIYVALFTTAMGLLVAIPLLMGATFMNVRIREMEEGTVENLEPVLSDLEVLQEQQVA